MTKSLLVAIVAAALTLAVHHARATVIEYRFGGYITELTDSTQQLDGSVLPGVRFSGTFAYDDGIPESTPLDDTGAYYVPSLASEGRLTLSVGNYVGYAKDSFAMVLYPGAPLTPWLEDDLFVYATTSLSGFVFTNGQQVFDPQGPFRGSDGMLGLSLIDNDGTYFFDDNLPLPDPNLASLEFKKLGVEYYLLSGPDRTMSNYFHITGVLDLFERDLPEPSGVSLLSTFLLAFVFVHWSGRWRSRLPFSASASPVSR